MESGDNSLTITSVLRPVRQSLGSNLIYVILLCFTLMPINTFSQQVTKSNIGNPHIYMPDTSEQGLVNEFRKMINSSETVMDAQVISKDSKWHTVRDEMFPNGKKEIYTEITLRVLHWIKGSRQDNEVIFYQAGGKIGDTEQVIYPLTIFNPNERAIFFLANRDPNTFLQERGRMRIYGSHNGKHGNLSLGTYQVDPEDYIPILKESATDTTAYPKYIHRLKRAEQERRIRELKWKNGVMPPAAADSVRRAVRQKMRERSDTTKGGVR